MLKNEILVSGYKVEHLKGHSCYVNDIKKSDILSSRKLNSFTLLHDKIMKNRFLRTLTLLHFAFLRKLGWKLSKAKCTI